MHRAAVTGLLVTALASAGAAGHSASPRLTTTYEAVLAGMSCRREIGTPAAERECEYRVGTGLHFAIAGVGGPDAAVTFYRASFGGDYYASFGIRHGCVVVKPGRAIAREHAGARADFAFVSPQTGKVFRDWRSCQAAGGPR